MHMMSMTNIHTHSYALGSLRSSAIHHSKPQNLKDMDYNSAGGWQRRNAFELCGLHAYAADKALPPEGEGVSCWHYPFCSTSIILKE